MGRRQHLLPAGRLVSSTLQRREGTGAAFGDPLRQPSLSAGIQSVASENRRRRVPGSEAGWLDDSIRIRGYTNSSALSSGSESERGWIIVSGSESGISHFEIGERTKKDRQKLDLKRPMARACLIM